MILKIKKKQNTIQIFMGHNSLTFFIQFQQLQLQKKKTSSTMPACSPTSSRWKTEFGNWRTNTNRVAGDSTLLLQHFPRFLPIMGMEVPVV
jgi:hypothetical protein